MSEPGHQQNKNWPNQGWQNPDLGAPQQQPHYAQAPLTPADHQGYNSTPSGLASSAQAAHQSWHLHWARPAAQHESAKGVAMKVINIMLLCLLALVTLGTLIFFALSIGASVFLVCGAIALIPLTICVLTLMWIDRWEPEPKTALLLGFCWGAGMAVITALVLGSWVQPLLMAGNLDADPDMVGAVIQAPLVEELCKGLGVLMLFFLRRRTFDGPIDGLVYAGMIAAGFAFTENILYFGKALEDSNGAATGLVLIFVMRGLMSPFAHVMFTGALGICVGYAARHGGTVMVLIAWVVGLIPAMFLHGLWNGSTFIGDNFFVIYIVLQVPIFVLFIVGIIFLRRAEAKLTRTRLSDYVPSGWFSPEEVPMLATGAGRRRALAWAKTFGAAKTMKEFIRLTTRLAFTRNRLLVDAHGNPGSAGAKRFRNAQAQELELLNKSTATRSQLLGQHAAALRN